LRLPARALCRSRGGLARAPVSLKDFNLKRLSKIRTRLPAEKLGANEPNSLEIRALRVNMRTPER